jgi:hypothetical protein
MKTKRALALVAALVPLLSAPAIADPVYTEDNGLSKQAYIDFLYAPVRLLGGASGALIGGPATGIGGTIDKISEAANPGDALVALYLAPLNIVKASVDCGEKGFDKPFSTASFGVTD